MKKVLNKIKIFLSNAGNVIKYSFNSKRKITVMGIFMLGLISSIALVSYAFFNSNNGGSLISGRLSLGPNSDLWLEVFLQDVNSSGNAISGSYSRVYFIPKNDYNYISNKTVCTEGVSINSFSNGVFDISQSMKGGCTVYFDVANSNHLTGTPNGLFNIFVETAADSGKYISVGEIPKTHNYEINTSKTSSACRNAIMDNTTHKISLSISNDISCDIYLNLANDLPNGYIGLDYIESTGTQYIDTGFSTTSGMIVKYKASWTGDGGYIVGSHSTASPYGRNGAYLDIRRGFWELGFGEEYPNNTTFERLANKIYNVEFSTVSRNGYLKINNQTIIQSSSVQATSPEPVYLFTNTYSLAGTSTSAKLYSVEIANSSGTVVRKLIPAMNLSTGEVGMYDTVNGVFYDNDGSGEFLYYISLDDYQSVNYLQATGSQYINLTNGFDSTDRMIATVAMDEATSASDKYFISPVTWNNSNNRFALGGFYESKFTYSFGAISTSDTHFSANADNNIHTYEYNNKTFYIRDLNVSANITPIEWGGTTANLRLFYGYNAPTKCKIYIYWHWKNGSLVNLLIPVYRKSDNVPGMYDLLSKTFYTNSGSGNFITG